MPMNRIIQGLNEFQTNYFTVNQELFRQLSQGQTPEILFITCSDSRIDPNLLTQTKPGELFIIRNLGNIIPPHGTTNNSEGAAIEYAVCALDIKHIIICGHSDCGSMKGLLQLNDLTEEMPLVYAWLKHHAESTRRLLKDNYKDYDGEKLLRIAIEENVLTQIENIETYPVIRSKSHSNKLSLHAWVYDIELGIISAYNAQENKFVKLGYEAFPVPDPLSSLQPN
ncbi:carbonic anhydrase [Crocosphaera sp. XPORK-15E]|uniref:carbonic anhydrase n=1 Tax=Crocosphaera sp. XPORK-15E TaxID=3110247 RepID=UPI002B21CC31|nr:carbonic anhydrase [Crocosphaera sp. XPORK-15E]